MRSYYMERNPINVKAYVWYIEMVEIWQRKVNFKQPYKDEKVTLKFILDAVRTTK
jgi:hypothetical protein